MAYQMAATAVTLNDFEGLFKCNPSNICAALYTISTDNVLARFLWISRTFLCKNYAHIIIIIIIIIIMP